MKRIFKVSGVIWTAAILTFMGLLAYIMTRPGYNVGQSYDNPIFTALLVGDIGIGVAAFMAAAISGILMLPSKPRLIVATTFVLLGLFVAGYSLFVPKEAYLSTSISPNRDVLGVSQQVTSPTPLQPTSSPTIKPYLPPKPTLDPDPIINCEFSSNCSGQILKVRKSECQKGICCQIGGSWHAYASKDKCTQDQKAGTTATYGNSYPSCFVYYPLLKTSSTYQNIPPDQCKQWQDQANSYASPVPTYQVQAAQPTINADQQDLLRRHDEACKAAVAEWNGVKENWSSTHQGVYTSSVEEVMALDQERQVWQQELNSAGCYSYTISIY